MLTWIPVISPIDVSLSSQPLLPRSEETVVEVEYVAREESPPTSLLARDAQETTVRENLERTPDQWRDKMEAAQKRLKGEE